jgi:hypothetical protein
VSYDELYDERYDGEAVPLPRLSPRARRLHRAAQRTRCRGWELVAQEKQARAERAEAERQERARQARIEQHQRAEAEALRIREYLDRLPRPATDVLVLAGAMCRVSGMAPEPFLDLLGEAYGHGVMDGAAGAVSRINGTAFTITSPYPSRVRA